VKYHLDCSYPKVRLLILCPTTSHFNVCSLVESCRFKDRYVFHISLTSSYLCCFLICFRIDLNRTNGLKGSTGYHLGSCISDITTFSFGPKDHLCYLIHNKYVRTLAINFFDQGYLDSFGGSQQSNYRIICRLIATNTDDCSTFIISCHLR